MKKSALKVIYYTHRLIVFPLIVAFSSLLLIILVVFPQVSALIVHINEENKLDNQAQVIEEKAVILEKANETDLKTKLLLATTAFPVQEDYSQIVGVLENIIFQNSFTIVSLRLSNIVTPSKTSAPNYTVHLELMGPKNLLSSLINTIEKSPRIMKVGNIEITDTQTGGNVNVALQVKVFYQGLPSTFGNADSPLPVLTEKDNEILAKLASLPVASESSATGGKGKQNPFE